MTPLVVLEEKISGISRVNKKGTARPQVITVRRYNLMKRIAKRLPMAAMKKVKIALLRRKCEVSYVIVFLRLSTIFVTNK